MATSRGHYTAKNQKVKIFCRGGLFAVAYTDAIQVAIAFIGSLGLLVFMASNFGLAIPAGTGPLDLAQLSDPAAGAPLVPAEFEGDGNVANDGFMDFGFDQQFEFLIKGKSFAIVNTFKTKQRRRNC